MVQSQQIGNLRTLLNYLLNVSHQVSCVNRWNAVFPLPENWQLDRNLMPRLHKVVLKQPFSFTILQTGTYNIRF